MDKYKYILTAIITLCAITTFAQPAQYTPMTAAGYQMKRLKVDSTLHLPSFCGTPTIRGSVAKEGALAIDTCGAFLYMYTRAAGWDTVNTSGGGGSSTDTTSLSNRINKKIDSLRRSNDSVYAFINGTKVFQFIDSVGGESIDTTNQFVKRLTRTPGVDSIIYFVGANSFAIKDSIGVAGSGTQNFVPKWSNTTTLENSQIFDSVNVGINTTTPAYKLDVNGEINTNQGIRIGNNNAKTGFYGGSNIIDFFAGNNKLSTWGLAPVGGSYFDNFPTFTYNTGDVGITNIIKIRGNAVSNSSNNAGVTQLDISPTYTQQTFGTGILRGIYYNPSLGSGGINTSKHIAFESASGNVVMKGLKTSSSTTDSIAIWINDTLSKAPYPSGGGNFLPLTGGTLTGNLNGTTATFSSNGSSNTFDINHTSGSGHGLEITKAGSGEGLIVNKTSGSGNAVTITGTFNATTIVKNGGTSSQFLKADGSVDATTYVSDTTALQRKSIPAYSILANNTNAAANVTAQQFRDTSGAYTGTITWNGVAPTSGNFSYRFTRIGKMVTINISLIYAVAGSANSTLIVTLPTDAPTPTKPAGLTSASNLLYPCYGNVNGTGSTTLTSSAFRGALRSNSANTGFEFFIGYTLTTPINANFTCTYFTD